MKLNHLLPLLCLTTAAAYAAPESFDFKDPKNINNAVFKLDAPLESVNGSANGITVPVKFTYLADKLSARVPSLKGDLLVIRANFSINREDFNIEKGQYEDKVANEIDLNLSIAGAAVKP
jgi:hypothetical protein